MPGCRYEEECLNTPADAAGTGAILRTDGAAASFGEAKGKKPQNVELL